jgi:hypothetical protein
MALNFQLSSATTDRWLYLFLVLWARLFVYKVSQIFLLDPPVPTDPDGFQLPTLAFQPDIVWGVFDDASYILDRK